MNGAEPLLDPARCRDRQARVARHMAANALDLLIVVTPEHVQYLTGHRWDHRFSPLAAMRATGEVLLVCPDRPAERPAADDVRTYEAKWRSTLAGAMYARAREIIAPGIDELAVFSSLQEAAVAVCGEMLTGTGNDYACGVRGGPPRPRRCEAGDLWILDLGPAYRGYFADTSRAIAVGGRPTDEQLAACERVCQALALVERIARPGVRCRDIYEEVRLWLADAPVGSWSSHLGHGIGLSVHEAPHLNPAWDDVLEEGDVIAVEPALYDPALRCGMRIENDYLVTATGLRNLSPFPLGLAD